MTKRMRIKIIDEVEFCCKKMKKYYEDHEISFDEDNDKMSYNGKMINECPFCKTFIEMDISVSHWGG